MLFPEPLGPTSAAKPPGSSSRSTSSTARAPREILRPEVLRPVYGEQLYFGRTEPDGRPFVLPWSNRGDGGR